MSAPEPGDESLNLTSSQLRRAREAINILSSLPVMNMTNSPAGSGEGTLLHAQPSRSLPSSTSTSVPSFRPSGSAAPFRSFRSASPSRSCGDIQARCDEALERLRSIRAARQCGGNNFRVEARSMLRQSRKRSSKQLTEGTKRPKRVWKHKFFCLAQVGQYRVPTNESEKDELFDAGLGEKEIEFEDLNISAEEFREIILQSFPQLHNAGGYQFCKCLPNSRKLEPLSNRVMASPQMLKQRVNNARTYIVPLQKDLDLAPTNGQPSSLTETCLACGLKVELSRLPEHLEICKTLPESTATTGSSHELDNSPLASEEDDDDFVSLPTWRSENATRPVQEMHVDLTQDEQVTEGELIQTAVEESMLYAQNSPMAPPYSPLTPQAHPDPTQLQNSPQTLYEVVRSLSKNILPEEVTIPIRRGHVLEDALRAIRRKHFPFNLTLKVKFLGEAGEDGGGPRREYFALLAKDIRSSLFEGEASRCFLRHDSIALQASKFSYVGNLMAMSLLQGGSGFPYFAPPMYEYLCGVDVSAIKVSIEDIPNNDVKQLLQQMEDASADSSLQDVCSNGIDLILETGYSKPVTAITLSCKQELMNTLMLHYTLYRNKAVLDQLKSGLCIMGVADAMITYPDLLQAFFVAGKEAPLTGETIKNLFSKVNFSEAGSNERLNEEATYMLFMDFLRDCEDGEISGTSLQHVLSFFTGAECLPPSGFDMGAEMQFNPVSTFPTASTCALVLTLPTKYHNNPTLFQEKMTYALQNHGGFGML